VALQIVQKASQADCDLKEIISLLRQDSGLCARVLKTVNSGLFGLSRPISSLKQAIVMLGAKPLRSLVLSLALPAVQSDDHDDLILRYWRESVAGAVLARQLAIHLGRSEPEDDLVAGLLRDVGILVLREVFPDEYNALWNSVSAQWGKRQCEEEKAAFGVDHAEVSACLLESWNLPVELFGPIRYHHEPLGAADCSDGIRQRAWLLNLASRIAMLQEDRSEEVEGLLQVAEQHFALDLHGLTAFLESIIPKIEEFAGILNLKIGQCPDYAAILTAGSDALVRLSIEASRAQSSAPAAGLLPGNTLEIRPSLGTTQLTAKPEGSLVGHTVAKSPNDLPDFDVSCLYSTYAGTRFRLRDYEVCDVVGRGGMGVVFKAHDTMLKRFVAIKMPTPERLVSAESRTRFLREAETSASIQHANIISIYAVNEIHGLPYIVMEYISGQSLQALLDKGGPLPVADVVQYCRQIAAGLHAAHERRIVHRDIKPANVLVSEGSRWAKITDFGLARVLDDPGLTQQGMWAGTPQFMAPEQFNGGRVDHRADLFALGSVLYTLCAGAPPFPGDCTPTLMKQICNDRPRSLRLLRPDVPPWLESLIARLHAKAPAARFESASQVVEAFERQESAPVR
jgi:HD-like signal output (HDOD) protein